MEAEPEITSTLRDKDYQLLLTQLADIYLCIGKDDFYPELTKFLKGWVSFNHIAILEFRKGLQPLSLYVAGEGYDQDLSKYLSGLYLFDPYYNLYTDQNTVGIFQVDLDVLADLEAEEEYKRYWRRIEGNTEIVGLYPISDDRCIHIGWTAHYGGKKTADEVGIFCRSMEKTIGSLLITHERSLDRPASSNEITRREIHNAVSALLDEFGSDILTKREGEITQLGLKGHSTKSIANILNISPGTVSIHRGNIHNKFGVSSQGELLSLFFTQMAKI